MNSIIRIPIVLHIRFTAEIKLQYTGQRDSEANSKQTIHLEQDQKSACLQQPKLLSVNGLDSYSVQTSNANALKKNKIVVRCFQDEKYLQEYWE